MLIENSLVSSGICTSGLGGTFGATVSPDPDSSDSSVPSVAEPAAVVAAAQARPAGEWLEGRGWDQNPWGGAFPTRASLDRALGGDLIEPDQAGRPVAGPGKRAD